MSIPKREHSKNIFTTFWHMVLTRSKRYTFRNTWNKGRTGQGILDNIVGVNINYEWAEKGINPRRIKDRYQSIGNYRLRVKTLL